MNLVKYSLGLICLAVIFLSSCKNDLKLSAPYKEYPSIYAILNPYESRQTIRINKVFLGEGNANDMAKVADSINYQPGEITVSLHHSSNKPDIVFGETTITTESGAYNTTQRVYYTDSLLEKTGTYTLTVKNNHTGNVFTGIASPLLCVNTTNSGSPLDGPYFPYNPGTNPSDPAYINYAPATGNISTSTKVNNVYLAPVENAKIYKLVIRSHFRVVATNTYDYVDYIIDNPKETLDGNIRIRFTSLDYFNSVGFSLNKKNVDKSVTGRKMWLIEYFAYASTQEFIDYNEYIKPSLSLNQNKPLYSNFVNKSALGIFTFRSSVSVQKEMSTSFINSFSNIAVTKDFFKP